MDCCCSSKKLYSGDYTSPEATFLVDGDERKRKRVINQAEIDNSHVNEAIESKLLESAEVWLPSQIDRISWD